MSFVDRFHTFVIDFNAAERRIFEKIRLKLPKYPNENLPSLLNRVLVYLHCYTPNLQFSATPLAEDQPTLYQLNHHDRFTQWVAVGTPELKTLRLNVRRFEECRFGVYFVNNSQIERFCHALRGTKENWVEPIRFYSLEGEGLSDVPEEFPSSSTWQVNQSEDTFFIECELIPQVIEFRALDIWKEYQSSLTKQNRTIS